MNKEALRRLPKVDELLKEEAVLELEKISSRTVLVESIRRALDNYRTMLIKEEVQDFSKDELIELINDYVKKSNSPHLKRVINATGTIIHTNLGRSLLSKKAADSVMKVALSYNNLEYNLEAGERGSRYSHVEDIIKKVTGAEAAMVVNNNAAAVLLTLNTLCKGKEAIVSRGQLVEIGGSFRIPDVMSFSGASLVEVGTTNRTHLYDYENNIRENTGVLLKVHTSNFKILGFTEEVPLEELVELGAKHSIPVVEDIGSGVLIDYSKYGFLYEPTVQRSIKKGVDIVTFSGDKMLGGPQAGIIVGKKEYIDRMKKNQLTRALRIDKMTLAALEATFNHYLEEQEAIREIPTLNMILMPLEEVKKKAQRLKRKLSQKGVNISLSTDFSMVGGGSMPTEKIPTYVLKVKHSSYSPEYMEKALRGYEEPIITRISEGELILDLRTIFEEDYALVERAFKELFS